MAPTSTPKDVIAKINAEVQRALQDPKVAQKLLGVGMEAPPPTSAAEFGTFIRDDIARWTGLVDAVGLEKLRD